MKKRIASGISVANITVLILVMLAPLAFVERAQAASLQQVMLRLDRLSASATTGGTVCVKTAVIDVIESDVVVTFPASFGVNATAANWDTTTTNLPSGATAWSITNAEASNVSGQAVTFLSPNLTADTLYCFNFVGTSTLTNNSAGDNQTGTVATGGNSSGYALSIISNDQIVVSATVPATFSFALSGNTDSFTTNLSSSAVVSTSGRTVTIGTNAASGWIAWVKSANAALNSVSTGAAIATAGTVNNTPDNLNPTTGYLLDVDITTDNATGTGTVTQAANYGAEYAGTTVEEGGTLSTTFQPIAASDGTTAGDVLTLTERAFITAVQAAATDYTDTLTVVGAGRF